MKQNKNFTEININIVYIDLNYQSTDEYFSVIEELLLGHPKLEKLKFVVKVDYRYFPGNSHEEKLTMTRRYEDFLKMLTTRSPCLKNIEIELVANGSVVRYDDACLLAAATKLVESVYIGYKSKTTKEGVMKFIDASPNLCEFDFSCICNDDEDVDDILKHLAENCPNLAVLELMDTSCSCDALKYALERLTGLRKIAFHLNNSEDINQVFEVMTKSLKDIKQVQICTSVEVQSNQREYLIPFFLKFTNLQSFLFSGNIGKKHSL